MHHTVGVRTAQNPWPLSGQTVDGGSDPCRADAAHGLAVFPPHPTRGHWPAWACALLHALAVLALCAPWGVTAANEKGVGPAAQDRPIQSAGDGSKASINPPRFDLDIQTDQSLRLWLLRHLELVRYQNLADLDAAELERLLARAKENLLDLLGTLGHFSPQIDIEGPVPTGSTPLGTVRIILEPGPTTRIASAQVYFRGDIADHPQAAEQRAAVRQALDLRVGDVFTQADWSRAKTAALRALTARRYPAGRLYNSLADVDPADHTVRLAIELDSGPPLTLEGVHIEGAERFDPAIVERLLRLSGVSSGSDYDLSRLQVAQQRLADSGYFDSVHVSVEPGVDQTRAPVRVQLREAQRQKLVLGIGGSTDSGARLSVEHTHHRVPGIGWRAVSKLQLERDDQQISTDWSAPVDDQGWQWITSAMGARQVDRLDTTTSQRLRLGQAQRNEALDRSFFLQFDRARSVSLGSTDQDGQQTDASLTAHYAWTRRRFDNLLFPQNGWGLGAELSAGYTLAGQRRPFGRTVGRWLGYWPLGGRSAAATVAAESIASLERPAAPVGSRWGRWALRAEVGAVWARADTPVPETQRFLTGGDASVRGYGLRDIGVPQADGSVSPGRYLALGSIEWQIPVWRDNQRTPWETVLFVDGGSVADRLGDLKPRWGLGTGVRYNSPVGPLRLDLAYGVQPRAWRLHFNVGFNF